MSPLANNGGPTQTMAIAASSPARDAGDTADAPSDDQRGDPRSGPADIGGTAPGAEAGSAANDGDQRTKRDAFHQSEQNLIASERGLGFIDEGVRRKIQRRDRDHEAAKNPDRASIKVQ